MDKPDAHSVLMEINKELMFSVKYGDAPAATVERIAAHTSGYVTQLQQVDEARTAQPAQEEGDAQQQPPGE